MTRRLAKPRPVQTQAGSTTRPGEIQVGRTDRWLRTTESGLQACFREGPGNGALSMFGGGTEGSDAKKMLVAIVSFLAFAHKVQTFV